MVNQSDAPTPYWKALFEFAQNVGSNDIVNQTPNQAAQMSAEDRQWLSEAMATMANATDPVRQMKLLLTELCEIDYATDSEEKKSKALEVIDQLTELCTFIDNANDFHKIGGFRILVPLLASPHAEFREAAANLIAELGQNNPYIQQKLKEAKFMDVLLELLDNDVDVSVRIKALYAISCSIRHNTECEEEFLAKDGFSYLLRALQSTTEKLIVKSAFLLFYLFEKPHLKNRICEMGFVGKFAKLLEAESERLAGPAREHILAALCALASGCPIAQEQCRKPEIGLKHLLFAIVRNTGGSVALDEEREHAERLITLCWPDESNFPAKQPICSDEQKSSQPPLMLTG